MIDVEVLDRAYVAVIQRALTPAQARDAMVAAGLPMVDAEAFVAGHNLPSVRLMARRGGAAIAEVHR